MMMCAHEHILMQIHYVELCVKNPDDADTPGRKKHFFLRSQACGFTFLELITIS
jgi:hypothetical protein